MTGTLIETQRRPVALQALPHADLLPAPLRRPLVGVLVAAVGVFVALAVTVAHTSAAGTLDLWAYGFIADHHSLRSPWMQLAVTFGEPATVVVVALAVTVVSLATGRRRLAALAVLGPGLTGIVTEVLKPIIGRTIADGSFAFPSGHTAGATAIGLLLAIALAGLMRQNRVAGLVALLAATVVGAGVVGVGLVNERAHYPTDTVGGLATAVIVTLTCALVIDRVAHGLHR